MSKQSVMQMLKDEATQAYNLQLAAKDKHVKDCWAERRAALNHARNLISWHLDDTGSDAQAEAPRD